MALAACAPVHAQARPVELEETARARIRVVRLRIEPAAGARPGQCLVLDEDDLSVRLRGEELPSSKLLLDRDLLPTLHALVIDSSGSMRGWLDDVREAASVYIDQLQVDRERALVVSFDDSVVLEQRVTADLDDLRRAIGRVRAGGMTSMYDALHYTVRELTSHRERPVVLLLIASLLPSAGCVPENLLFNLYTVVGTALFNDLANLAATTVSTAVQDRLNLPELTDTLGGDDGDQTPEQPPAPGG